MQQALLWYQRAADVVYLPHTDRVETGGFDPFFMLGATQLMNEFPDFFTAVLDPKLLELVDGLTVSRWLGDDHSSVFDFFSMESFTRMRVWIHRFHFIVQGLKCS